jgi:hypothetical protein
MAALRRLTSFDLPILEYRPYRIVSSQQSSSLLIEPFVAADVPGRARLEYPRGMSAPKLHTIWSFGVRVSFDWRYYP